MNEQGWTGMQDGVAAACAASPQLVPPHESATIRPPSCAAAAALGQGVLHETRRCPVKADPVHRLVAQWCGKRERHCISDTATQCSSCLAAGWRARPEDRWWWATCSVQRRQPRRPVGCAALPPAAVWAPASARMSWWSCQRSLTSCSWRIPDSSSPN